jgi:hypothetical protein
MFRLRLFDLVFKHNQHFINMENYNIKTIVTSPSLATNLPKTFVKWG